MTARFQVFVVAPGRNLKIETFEAKLTGVEDRIEIFDSDGFSRSCIGSGFWFRFREEALVRAEELRQEELKVFEYQKKAMLEAYEEKKDRLERQLEEFKNRVL